MIKSVLGAASEMSFQYWAIYQSVAERKLTLEQVMAEVGGKMTVIAHVACNNTADRKSPDISKCLS